MEEIVGKYEPTSLPRSFFNQDGDLNRRQEDKPKLVHVIRIDRTNVDGISSFQPDAVCSQCHPGSSKNQEE